MKTITSIKTPTNNQLEDLYYKYFQMSYCGSVENQPPIAAQPLKTPRD